MQKLLICGDSFAADWTAKRKGVGWVNMLEQDFNVKNIAQAGCSQYKILKQLQSIRLSDYDKIIVSHTSPYRLYVEKHPVHNTDSLHKNSCLLYTDIIEHVDNNPDLKPIVEYFEKYFDLEYAEHIQNLLLQEIDFLVPNNTLHLSHVEWKNLYKFKSFINFKDVFAKHRGDINHYTEQGNHIVYQKVLEKL
jgi:hypothetical protein